MDLSLIFRGSQSCSAQMPPIRSKKVSNAFEGRTFSFKITVWCQNCTKSSFSLWSPKIVWQLWQRIREVFEGLPFPTTSPLWLKALLKYFALRRIWQCEYNKSLGTGPKPFSCSRLLALFSSLHIRTVGYLSDLIRYAISK